MTRPARPECVISVVAQNAVPLPKTVRASDGVYLLRLGVQPIGMVCVGVVVQHCIVMSTCSSRNSPEITTLQKRTAEKRAQVLRLKAVRAKVMYKNETQITECVYYVHPSSRFKSLKELFHARLQRLIDPSIMPGGLDHYRMDPLR